MAQGKAAAIANNDYVHVAWDFGEFLPNCDGFAVYRITDGGESQGEPLSVFGRDAKGNRLKISCEDYPIHKYKLAGRPRNARRPLQVPRGSHAWAKQPMSLIAPAVTPDWVDVSPRQRRERRSLFQSRHFGSQSAADKDLEPQSGKA